MYYNYNQVMEEIFFFSSFKYIRNNILLKLYSNANLNQNYFLI